MTTDRIFVLMLVIMIPMSGCFGGVGDAEANDSTDGTTVINNYYNNTTTVVTPQIETFSVGGQVFSTTLLENNRYQMYSFNTSAGEMVMVKNFDIAGGNYAYINSDCGHAHNGSLSESTFQTSGKDSFYLFGSHADCTHTLEISEPNSATVFANGVNNPSYSLVYSILQTTPIISNSV